MTPLTHRLLAILVAFACLGFELRAAPPLHAPAEASLTPADPRPDGALVRAFAQVVATVGDPRPVPDGFAGAAKGPIPGPAATAAGPCPLRPDPAVACPASDAGLTLRRARAPPRA